MNLFKFLSEIFFKEIANVIKLSKLLKTAPKEMLNTFYKNPEKFAEKLKDMGAKQRKIFSEDIMKAQQQGDMTKQFAMLSSSWIASGTWDPSMTGDVGDLTITLLKTGDSYTYPGVSIKVWEAMKRAKGKNGGGAGSVFWAMYLRKFKGSTYGRLQAKVFKLAGIKSMSPDSLKKLLRG